MRKKWLRRNEDKKVEKKMIFKRRVKTDGKGLMKEFKKNKNYDEYGLNIHI